jgi:hypothetical protein
MEAINGRRTIHEDGEGQIATSQDDLPASCLDRGLRGAGDMTEATVFVDNAKINGEGSRQLLASRLPETAATFVRPLKCSLELFTMKTYDLNVRVLRGIFFIFAS